MQVDLDREVERKAIRRIGVATASAVGLMGVVMIVPGLAGSGANVLSIHNKGTPVTVEVMVPRIPRPCGGAADLRLQPEDYCLHRKVEMGRSARARIGVPDPKDECPQVWLRAIHDGWVASAIFELPARIEVERDGNFDQKGIGAPNMYAGPPSSAQPRCEVSP